METMTFKPGDEVWWFQTEIPVNNFYMKKMLKPDSIKLVHDIVKKITGDILICEFSSHFVEDIWGKSRLDAWTRLKKELEKWGKLDAD